MHTRTRSQDGASTRPEGSDSKTTRRWSVVPRSIRVLTGEAVARMLRVPSRDRGHSRPSPRSTLEHEKLISSLRLLGRINLRLVIQHAHFFRHANHNLCSWVAPRAASVAFSPAPSRAPFAACAGPKTERAAPRASRSGPVIHQSCGIS
jgi:hypothetical protein